MMFPLASLVLSAAIGFADGPVVSTVAGTGKDADNGPAGKAADVNVGQPFGVEVGPDGALYVTEVGNHRVWRLDRRANTLAVVAGNGKLGYAGDGGPAAAAAMNEPYEVRFDAGGNLFVVEMKNHVVRKIDRKSGVITTVAGTGRPGFSGDGGPATKAAMKQPHGIAFDAAGRLYVADIGNYRIRRIDLKTGTIDTVAGDGTTKPATDGAKAAGGPLPGPRALAVAKDSLYVALREGHAVWRIDLSAGTLHHVAGTGKPGYAGDGGPAAKAAFRGPKGLAADPADNLYVADSENDAVRFIDAKTGVVTTLAGPGTGRGFGGDGGPAAAARFAQPHGICVDADGTVYLGDTRNHRVRAVSPGR